MRFFKYLFFICLILFSVHANAISSSEIPSTSMDPDAYCKSLGKSYSYRDGFTSDGVPMYRCTPGGNAFTVSELECPSTVTSNPINVPGWSSWDIDQTEAYHNKIANETACYKGCKYKGPAIGGTDPQLHLIFGDPKKDSSCPNTETKPNTPPPPETPDDPTCGKYCDRPPYRMSKGLCIRFV